MPNKKRIVVTGIGIMTGNGLDRESFYENSMNGVSGIRECTIFNVSNLKTKYVGQIPKEMPVLSNDPMDKTRFQVIVESALKEMFDDSGLNREMISQYGRRAALSLATSLATYDKINGYSRCIQEGNYNPGWLPRLCDYIPDIKREAGVKGAAYVASPACAAGTVAAGIAYDLIQQDKADIVVVGGADPLTQMSCTGFHVLKALSNSICKPFDTERDGINIGEGGAFFLFESEESALKRNCKIYGEILGYGTCNEAYHITTPDPEGSGAITAMSMALKNTNVEKEDIDLINAHGTGTKLNDAMEVKALNKFFDNSEHELMITANKSMTGHCLAGTGAIELAATLLCIKNQKVMPNISLHNKMALEGNKIFPTESEEHEIHYAISNSFAFAGNVASILVGEYHRGE